LPDKFESKRKMSDEIDINDEKLKNILSKTLDMFFEFGIRNLNMDDISRNLKISKKTLYQYFKSKEDLIRKLFQFEDMKWCVDSKIDMKGLNAIDILLKASLMVFDEMKRFKPMLKFELKKYYEPIFNEYLLKKRNHIFQQISSNLKQGIEEGLYRQDINVDLVSSLYVNNLVDMHNNDYCAIENITFTEVFQVMFESHIRAISSINGISYFEKKKPEILALTNINNL